MRTLLLVAAGGLAREALAVERTRGHYSRYLLLDDDPCRWGTIVDGVPVAGGVDRVEHEDGDVVVCAGRGAARRAIVDRLTASGVPRSRYATVRHPSVEVPDGSRVGEGSILLAQVVLTADVLVGSHVVAMPHVTLTHDDIVEDFATLCAGVTLGGHVRVGAAAYVGMNACVREHQSIGPGATLGMGGVLLESLPAGETWAGVPAQRLRPRVPAGV